MLQCYLCYDMFLYSVIFLCYVASMFMLCDGMFLRSVASMLCFYVMLCHIHRLCSVYMLYCFHVNIMLWHVSTLCYIVYVEVFLRYVSMFGYARSCFYGLLCYYVMFLPCYDAMVCYVTPFSILCFVSM